MHVIDKPVPRNIIWTVKRPASIKNSTDFYDRITDYAYEYCYDVDNWGTVDKGPDGTAANCVSVFGFDETQWLTFFYSTKTKKIFIQTRINTLYDIDIDDILKVYSLMFSSLNTFCQDALGNLPKLVSYEVENNDGDSELTIFPGHTQLWKLNATPPDNEIFTCILEMTTFNDFPTIFDDEKATLLETGAHFTVYFSEDKINEVGFLYSRRSNTFILQTFFDYSGYPDDYGTGENEARYEDISEKLKIYCKKIFGTKPVLIDG